MFASMGSSDRSRFIGNLGSSSKASPQRDCLTIPIEGHGREDAPIIMECMRAAKGSESSSRWGSREAVAGIRVRDAVFSSQGIATVDGVPTHLPPIRTAGLYTALSTPQLLFRGRNVFGLTGRSEYLWISKE